MKTVRWYLRKIQYSMIMVSSKEIERYEHMERMEDFLYAVNLDRKFRNQNFV